jgi:hypothetical protein
VIKPEQWEVRVGMIMIRCPQTGRVVSTGIKADFEQFRCSAVFFARTLCSICNSNHEWFAKEAWVSETAIDRRAPRSIRVTSRL